MALCRPRLAAAAATLLVVLAAACGGRTVQARDIVRGAHLPAHGPARIVAVLTVEPQGQGPGPSEPAALAGAGPFTVRLSGPIDTRTGAAQLRLAVDRGALELLGRISSNGSRTLLQLAGRRQPLPTGSAAALDRVLASVDAAAATITSPRIVDTEPVGGVTTTHLAGQLSAASARAAVVSVPGFGRLEPVRGAELWIGADGIIRRVRLRLAGDRASVVVDVTLERTGG